MHRNVVVSLLFIIGPTALADVPQQINHQGMVSVDGTPFNGSGSFKFSIVDRTTGVNLWCNNDNDPVNTTPNCAGQVGAVPGTAVSIAVTNGVYTVRLGDTGLANMTPLPSSVFTNANTALRIWFDDGVNGSQQLTPDHMLTTSPYAARSETLDAKYVFQAYSTDTVGPTLPVNSIVQFAETIDPSNVYADPTFTAPVDGYYFLSTNISFGNGQADGSDGMNYMFLVNGTVEDLKMQSGPNMIAVGGNPMTQSTSGVLYLQQGDTVQVRLTGVQSPINYANRSFGGFLIGQ